MTQPGQKRNYQKELDRLIEGLREEGRVPKLLLHSCCAPCSSYVLEYLSQYFDVTVYYYNPNIFPETEYEARVKEQERLIREMETERPVRFLAGSYEPEEFFSVARGHEKDPEGGERCFRCYELRLDRAARAAVSGDFDYFTTTLTISPLKNAQLLNSIGAELAEKYGIPWLYSDFKKREGYKRSIILSKEYDLYRQNYCGCVFSKRDSMQRKN